MVFESLRGFQPNKVKPALAQAIIRIKILRKKREASIKGSKKSVADFLTEGKIEKARLEAERIVRDDFVSEAYDILELMCELVKDNVKSIAAEVNCPYDLMEAVCTLIYAANRTDISELAIAKKQLQIKYGKDFVLDAMNNRGGVVNERVLHRMSGQRPNAFLVLNYMKEIAKEFNVDWEPDELTAEAGERFDVPMVAPDGSSILPGNASGLGAAAYQVTDGRINASNGINPDLSAQSNAIIDNTKGQQQQMQFIPPAPPQEEIPAAPVVTPDTTPGNDKGDDEIDLDSLTARFQAFKNEQANPDTNIDATAKAHPPPTQEDGLNFDIPAAPSAAPTEDDNEPPKEDEGAVPKYDELLNRFAKLKSNK